MTLVVAKGPSVMGSHKGASASMITTLVQVKPSEQGAAALADEIIGRAVVQYARRIAGDLSAEDKDWADDEP